jgi:hypothetical protein
MTPPSAPGAVERAAGPRSTSTWRSNSGVHEGAAAMAGVEVVPRAVDAEHDPLLAEAADDRLQRGGARHAGALDARDVADEVEHAARVAPLDLLARDDGDGHGDVARRRRGCGSRWW